MQTTYLPKLTRWIDPIFWLYFPKNCPACGRPLRLFGANICGRCSQNLPETHFFEAPGNPIEKIFYGRLPIQAGAAAWYFHKNSALQALLFQLKYKSNEDVGLFIGKQMGALLAASERFASIDALVPMPLHPQAQKVASKQPRRSSEQIKSTARNNDNKTDSVQVLTFPLP